MAKTSVQIKQTSAAQIQFLEKVKQLLPSSMSQVHVLSELLDISTDGSYRRIRGETALSLDEIIKICNHFRISFDSFCNGNDDTVTFTYKAITSNEAKFDEYLDGILSDLMKISSFEQKQIIYSAEDPPPFHYFNYPYLTAFKLYYWKKAIVSAPSLEGVKFDPAVIHSDQIDTARKILKEYTKIPSIEIWSEDTIYTVIKQIEFYYDSGFFLTREDALKVCGELMLMVKSLQKQAELSTKFISDSERVENEGNFTLYQSEVMIGTNCIFVTTGDIKTTYLAYNTVNSMITTNPNFCIETESWLKALIRKSGTISGVGEKQRYRFFKSMQDKVNALIAKIKE